MIAVVPVPARLLRPSWAPNGIWVRAKTRTQSFQKPCAGYVRKLSDHKDTFNSWLVLQHKITCRGPSTCTAPVSRNSPGLRSVHYGQDTTAAAVAPVAKAHQTQAWPDAPATTSEEDNHFMHLALHQAQLAAEAGEVPVGAVLVVHGQIIAAGHNQTEGQASPLAHAELSCLQSACRELGAWRLLNATMYVTLEPCPMCAGAMLQARLGALVYGAANPLLGADGSWLAMFPGRPAFSASAPARPHPFHPRMEVRRGVLAEESSRLLRTFFAQRRKLCKAREVDAGLTSGTVVVQDI